LEVALVVVARAVSREAGRLAVGVVGEGVGGLQAVAADARQLPAPLPGKRAAVVGQGVALRVVGDG